MSTLPEPNFIGRDSQAITTELVAKYESMTGKTLYPAQVERLMIDLIAYAKTMTHIGIQEAGKQNLVRFAREPMLDYLGELMNVLRLPAASAKTVLRFSVAASLAVDVAIPAGTLVDSSDSKVTFETDVATTLAAGKLSVDVVATCNTTGTAGNGWQPGQLNVLASDVGDVAFSVANITVSADGIDDESNDRYRARLMEGPESFTVAGPRGAYRFHAMSAHQSIIDVGVVGPELELVNGQVVSTNQVPPGAVFVYPLISNGAPNAEILSQVEAMLNTENVRPLCDLVQVLPPTAADYVIHAALTLYASADATTTLAAARAAAQAFANDRAAGLARDVVPSQVMSTLSVPGVYQVVLTGLDLLTLDSSQWARCTDINITVAGVAYG
jgi:phage-related baseplate assembly protein